MKKQQKLQEAIGLIGEDLIHRAHDQKQKGLKLLRRWYLPAVAAVLAVVTVTGLWLWPKNTLPGEAPLLPQAVAAVLAEGVYPTPVQYPGEDLYFQDQQAFQAAYKDWIAANKQRNEAAKGAADTTAFLQKTLVPMLASSGGENKVYSPINLYIALSMVAETAGGNSLCQILDLLDQKDLDDLRQQVFALWQAHYRDDGVVVSRLANSLWLNENVAVEQGPLDRLAKQYYASSFAGQPGTEGFDRALQEWLSQQTGGLLDDAVQNVQLTPETALTLASTVFYRAKWDYRFDRGKTAPAVFFGLDGEQTVDFMNRTFRGDYYWTSTYGAVQLPLEESGGMWVFLPDEGVDVDTLLTDPSLFKTIRETGDHKELMVQLSLPKFDVSARTDLIPSLKQLGVTDVFDFQKADFTPLTQQPLAITSALHGARVQVDEEGCVATAMTVIQEAGSAMPPKDEVVFRVDRPFLFMITSEYGVPLFVGVVRNM